MKFGVAFTFAHKFDIQSTAAFKSWRFLALICCFHRFLTYFPLFLYLFYPGFLLCVAFTFAFDAPFGGKKFGELFFPKAHFIYCL